MLMAFTPDPIHSVMMTRTVVVAWPSMMLIVYVCVVCASCDAPPAPDIVHDLRGTQ
jgi:hypothetical protein